MVGVEVKIMEKGSRIQITLTADMLARLDEYCRNQGIKRSAAVTIALNALIRREGNGAEK